jgi:hypothetical protein
MITIYMTSSVRIAHSRITGRISISEYLVSVRQAYQTDNRDRSGHPGNCSHNGVVPSRTLYCTTIPEGRMVDRFYCVCCVHGRIRSPIKAKSYLYLPVLQIPVSYHELQQPILFHKRNSREQWYTRFSKEGDGPGPHFATTPKRLEVTNCFSTLPETSSVILSTVVISPSRAFLMHSSQKLKVRLVCIQPGKTSDDV